MSLRANVSNILERYKVSRNRTATVRYMFPAALGVVALLGAMSLSAVDSSFVLLETDVQAVASDELFEIAVLASAHTPVNAVDITLAFPPEKLEVFSIDRGQSVLTIWTEDPVSKEASIRFSGGTFRRGFIGKHEIATVTFRALQSGRYEVAISDAQLVAGDGSGTEVPVTPQSGSRIALFNFDENTSPEEIKVALASGVVTDLNGDGKVTLQDISAFMGAWSSRSQLFDFDRDGRMTFRDFSIILATYFLQ